MTMVRQYMDKNLVKIDLTDLGQTIKKIEREQREITTKKMEKEQSFKQLKELFDLVIQKYDHIALLEAEEFGITREEKDKEKKKVNSQVSNWKKQFNKLIKIVERE